MVKKIQHYHKHSFIDAVLQRHQVLLVGKRSIGGIDQVAVVFWLFDRKKISGMTLEGKFLFGIYALTTTSVPKS